MNHPQVPLGEVADFVNGAAFKPEDWGVDGLPIIRIQNLTDLAKPFNYTERIVPEKLVVNPGDLLVSWSATLGVFQWNGPKGLLNQHIFRVLPNDEVVDKNYLKHTLGQAINDMERHLHGATMKHVNRAEFLGTRIPLPSLEEQQRIAAILDKADLLASLQDRASVISKEWVSSAYSECFANSGSYIEISIEEALESQILLLHKDGNHGGSYPRAEDFGDVGVPFISAKSIDDSGTILDSLVARLSEEKAQSLRIGWLEPGDVLLAHNASVGKTALYEGQYQRALIGTSLTAFRPNPNHLNSHYLLHCLSSPSFQGSLAADMSQTTRNQVPITAQRRLSLRIPPINKQEEFAERVMSANILSGKRRQSFRCVDALRKSLFGALLSP